MRKKRNWSKEYTAQQQVGETFEEARAQTVQRDNKKKILNDPVSWNPARITKPVQDNHFSLLYTPCAGCLPPLLCCNVLFTRSGNAGNFCFPFKLSSPPFSILFCECITKSRPLVRYLKTAEAARKYRGR